MAMVILPDECIACSACWAECPDHAITAEGLSFHIHPEFCGEFCFTEEFPPCTMVCPTNAIVPTMVTALTANAVLCTN